MCLVKAKSKRALFFNFGQSQNILTLQNTVKGAVHKGRHFFREEVGEVSCLLTVDNITGAGVQCYKTRPGNYCVST